MAHTYWHKQTAEQPLFPDVLWSRPETKRQAGKLLVVGGSVHGFAAPAEAYSQSQAAGGGLTRVLLPLSVKPLLPKGILEADFAPSTPSGSFSQPALAEVLDAAEWADATLLAGDFGRNSETAILLEQLLIKYSGQLTLAQDAIDYFTKAPAVLLQRPDTLMVPNFTQLQKLATAASFTTAFTSNMDFLHLVDGLHEFTAQHGVHLILNHLQTIFVAVNGQVSTTKPAAGPGDEIKLAAHAAIWWLQNPTKPFEALTASLLGNN